MTSFDGYFPNGDLNVRDGCIRDPFLFNLDLIEDGDMAKDELIELKENQKVKMVFDSMELTTFWCHQLKVFLLLTERALNVVVPFVTTYLCESGFSALLHIKKKARNRLNPGHGFSPFLANHSHSQIVNMWCKKSEVESVSIRSLVITGSTL